MPERLLVVDDESHVRESTMRLLQRKGYEVEGANSGTEALTKLSTKYFDLMLVDIRMPGMSGLELLRKAKEANPELMALFMTGYGTVENAIEALQLGALGFVRKPIPIDELTKTIDEALAKERLKRENAKLRALMPLFEVSKVFLSEVDENKLLNLLLDKIVSETKADIAQILLSDDTGNLALKATRGLSTKYGLGSTIINDSAVKAISALEPEVVNHKNLDKSDELQQQSGLDIYVPLIILGKAIGVMKATKLGSITHFPQSEMEFLVTLCGQAAIAIANARLFESVQKKQAEVEELLKRVIDTTESERLRLTLELHDGPLQTIVAAQYGVEAARTLVNRNDMSKTETKLEGIQKMLAQSVHDIRRIVRDLHPPALGQSGLVSAVQEYLSNLERDDDIACHLELRGKMVGLEPGTERGVYYVVREALTNVRKHAEAKEVNVLIDFQDNQLIIEVADNGKGFDLAAANNRSDTGHVGLRGMSERARVLNGDINIEPNPGGGTRVKVRVPIKKNEPKEAILANQKSSVKQGGEPT